MDEVTYYTSVLNSLLAWLRAHSANVTLILVSAWALIFLTKVLTRRACQLVRGYLRGEKEAVAEQAKRTKTLFSLLARVINAAIFTFAVIMLLAEVGVNVTALLAGAGVIGIAIGFGAQSIVKDMLAGLFMLLEDQYRVGDIVEVNGGAFGGTVERLTLRTTWLRGLDGKLHIIPNGNINAVSNFTHTWSCAMLDIGVGYGDDVDNAIKVIQDTASLMAKDEPWRSMIIGEPDVLGVEDLGDSAVIIRLLVKTLPMSQWKAGREMRRRIKYALESAGISIPFPQVTVSCLKEQPVKQEH